MASDKNEKIEAQLCAYVDGELDAAARAEIERHLASHPEHRKLLEELTLSRQLLAGLPREKAPADVTDGLRSQLERSALLDGVEDETHEMTMRINRWPQLRAIAAAIVVLGTLAAVLYNVLPSPHRQPELAILKNTQPTEDSIARSPAERDLDLASAKDSSDLPAGVGGLGGGGAGGRGGRFDESETRSKATVESNFAQGNQPLEKGSIATNTPDPFTIQPLQQKEDAAKERIANAENGQASDDRVFAESIQNQLRGTANTVREDAMVIVVNSRNPAGAEGQVAQYFAANNIRWEPVTEPPPAPLAVSQNAAGSRMFQRQTVEITGANLDKAIAEQKGQAYEQSALALGAKKPGAAASQPALEPRPEMPVQKMLVARDMTPEQAEELSATLRQPVGQQARMFSSSVTNSVALRDAGKFGLALNAAGPASMTPQTPVTTAPSAAISADEASRARELQDRNNADFKQKDAMTGPANGVAGEAESVLAKAAPATQETTTQPAANPLTSAAPSATTEPAGRVAQVDQMKKTELRRVDVIVVLQSGVEESPALIQSTSGPAANEGIDLSAPAATTQPATAPATAP